MTDRTAIHERVVAALRAWDHTALIPQAQLEQMADAALTVVSEEIYAPMLHKQNEMRGVLHNIAINTRNVENLNHEQAVWTLGIIARLVEEYVDG